ncbi:MAG: HTH domain-containing protein [Patescibacteria group bacterium]|nr:HTH domain-containing protein [Patescibacteria group bacterium]
MNSFKDLAYKILKESGKPLHSKEITKRALEHGLVTDGKTPEATMNALLVVDINTKKEKSRFIKTDPSTFGINPKFEETKQKTEKEKKVEKIYKISKDVSTKQKGDIAEARIAELVALYGDTTLSCYKPISDDEGIDLIVKEKGSLKTMYIQIKSRFGDNPDGIFTATTKALGVVDNYSMATVFCFFDTEQGDIWEYLWFVPAPDFLKMANKLDNGKSLGFVAGRKRNDSNKWDNYLIDKRDLANQIIAQMKRI